MGWEKQGGLGCHALRVLGEGVTLCGSVPSLACVRAVCVLVLQAGLRHRTDMTVEMHWDGVLLPQSLHSLAVSDTHTLTQPSA